MQRDVRRIPHHPTVVTGRSGWNIKEHSGAEFVDRAVLHRSRGTSGEHHPNMLDVAARRAHARPDMNGPLPSGLVRGTADGHAPDANQLKFSFFEHSYFVRLLKALQNCLKHLHNSLASRCAEMLCIMLVHVRCFFSQKFLGVLYVSAVKRSSLPCTAQQCQTCTASRKPRASRPDACAPAFHLATESARPMPAEMRMDLALPRAAAQWLQEHS